MESFWSEFIEECEANNHLDWKGGTNYENENVKFINVVWNKKTKESTREYQETNS